MQIKDSRYHKVWQKKTENGFTKLNLGDSKKNKAGEYDNWTWFDVLLVGGAKETAVSEGDTITINSGVIAKRKYNEKYYDDIVVFDFEVTKKAEDVPVSTGQDFEPDIPF